jgi:LysM repeat protein
MKIQLPKIFAKKSKTKLRATAARKPLRIAATADYEEMAEPNMKLSRALLIVLVLHVVAVSGIIAFNALKTHQSSAPLPRVTTSADATGPSESKAAPAAHGTAITKETSAHVEANHASSKSANKEEGKSEHPKAIPVDARKIYVVAKGDNPARIAKKLKVPYDELLSVNHIEDPHKLQIGQKLVIPTKPPKAKKVEE